VDGLIFNPNRLNNNLGKSSGILPRSRYAREQGILVDLRRVLDARKTYGRYGAIEVRDV